MVFSSHKFSSLSCEICWCRYLYFTTFGEKIYINQAQKPSKINGLRRLSNAYLRYIQRDKMGVVSRKADSFQEVRYADTLLSAIPFKRECGYIQHHVDAFPFI